MPRKSPSKAPSIEQPSPIRRAPFFSRPPVIMAILGTMVVSAVYLWIAQPNPPSSSPEGSQEAQAPSEDTVSGLIARVAQLIVVKSDETPTVYSVTDASVFIEAWPEAAAVKEGDKVLEWSDKTIIYSPTQHKIVAVLPQLSHEQPSNDPAPEALVPEEGVTVEIRNGSGVAGAASRLQQSLRAQGFTVSRIGDAATRLNEGGTVIVDLSNGATPNALTLLIGATSGTVTTLPTSEPTSESGLLVIIGNK